MWSHACSEDLNTSSLTLFLQLLQNDRHRVDMLELLNFGNPSGSGPTKGYKRVQSKHIFTKRENRTKSTKQGVKSLIKSWKV